MKSLTGQHFSEKKETPCATRAARDERRVVSERKALPLEARIVILTCGLGFP
jgi:hypothetical protein